MSIKRVIEHDLTGHRYLHPSLMHTSQTWPIMMNVLFTLFDLGLRHSGNEHLNKNLI